MNQQTPTANKKSFLQGQRLLVCSLLVLAGFCVLALVGAGLWGLDRRNKALSANATSTAFVLASRAAEQQANATATAAVQRANARATATVAALATQEARYEFVEPFDDNKHAWRVETVHDDMMNGSLAIRGGVYEWNIQEVKQAFYSWSAYPAGDWDKDFDMYVDFKVAEGAPDGVCGGFLFRTASIDWEEGAYIFSVCNDSDFSVSYYGHEEWDAISGQVHSDAIQRADWNRLMVSARGSTFAFTINDEVVFEMNDDRSPAGRVLLFMEVSETEPTLLWFDNFAFRHR